MNNTKTALEGYLSHRLQSAGSDLFEPNKGAAMLRTLAGCISPPGDQQLWKRRPSISDNGEPVVLSLKISGKTEQAVRLLVESGSLRMTVAQQIAYSLKVLDELLGKLKWQDAAAVINLITNQIFPPNPTDTSFWRGGIWLGAEYTLRSGELELRMYFNLRHGTAQQRWLRLQAIISSFASDTIDPFLEEWKNRSQLLAIPVGLGVVIRNNKVSGVRAYLGVDAPSSETIAALVASPDKETDAILAFICSSFSGHFGPIARQGVTIGYDFVPYATEASRVKVDLCCELIKPGATDLLTGWLTSTLSEIGMDQNLFVEFLSGLSSYWRESKIQFLSLGFSPAFQHATIYVNTLP